MDVRFIVKAEKDWLASNKILDFLPESTNEIQYTIIRKIKERK